MSIQTHTALRNVSYNIIGYIYPMILALIVTPITIHMLGVRTYGLYIFTTTLISVLGLLDLGIGTAISRLVSKYHAQQKQAQLQNLLGSAHTIFTLIGVVGFIFFIATAFIGHAVVSPDIINYEYYHITLIFAGLLFLIQSIGNIYTIIPTAIGRFDISNKIGLGIITLQQISIAGAALLHFSIVTIIMIQCIIACVQYIITKLISRTILPHISYTFTWDKHEIVYFYKFGLASFANGIAGSLLTYLDRLIIPLLLGPSNLTYYSLPGNITSKLPGLSNTLSTILFPLAAQHDGDTDLSHIKRIYTRATRLILVISTAMAISMISFAYEILRYWINADVADKASTILIVLACTNLVLAMLSPITNILLGLGKLKSLTIASLTMALLNAVLLCILIPVYGLIGAAWAYLIALLPIIWLIYRIEYVYLRMGSSRLRFYTTIMCKLGCVALITYLFNTYIALVFIINIWSLLFFMFLSMCVFMLVYMLLGFFEKEDMKDIYAFIRNTFVSKIQ